MAIRPLAEIDAQTGEDAFEDALAQKASEEAQEDNRAVGEPVHEELDIEIIEGEPEPEETEDKVDSESSMLGKLVDMLSDRQPAPVAKERKARAPIAQADMAEIRKKFDSKLHEVDNPSELLDEYANALVGTALANQNLEIQELKKDKLKNDPINAMVFEKWDDEIEDVIANLPANQQTHPDAYKYALKEVRNEHLEEIIEARIAERGTTARTKPGANKGISGGGSNAGTAKRKTKKVYASPHDKNEAKRYGLSLENYLRGKGKY